MAVAAAPGTPAAPVDCRLFNAELKLQLLHGSDQESSLQDPNTLEPKALHYATIYDGLKRFATLRGFNTIHLNAGDLTLPGPFYQAAQEVSDFGAPGVAEIEIFNALHLDANAVGNHDLDGGINEFATMVARAQFPFLGVNMDFSRVVLADTTPPLALGIDGGDLASNGASVIRYGIRRVRGQCIGVIGRAPADLFEIVEDPENNLPGLDFLGGRDPETNQALVSAVELVDSVVAEFKAAGVNKIILLDHAQDFTEDPLSADALHDIDIIVSAGSTGFLAKPVPDGPFNLLRPGDNPSDSYPSVQLDREGKPLLIVNTDQQYRYVGNLMVTFDRSGRIDPTTDVDPRSGPVATTAAAIARLDSLVPGPALAAPADVLAIYEALQDTDSIQQLLDIVGMTTYPLNALRADVRSRETNLGRLAADSSLAASRQSFPDLQVDVALKNGGGLRDTIAGPAITRFSIHAALPFDNRLAVVEVTAPQLIATMENGVSRVAALADDPISDGRFPHIAGMAMRFDATRPALEAMAEVTTPSRVERLIVTSADGSIETVVEDYQLVADATRTFVLTTNAFLLTGGDGYIALGAGTLLGETEIGEQQILEEYIGAQLGATITVADPPPAPRVVQLQ